MKKIRIIGIDPGSRRTGYGIIEHEGSKLHHIAHGVISPPIKETSHKGFIKRIDFLFSSLHDKISTYKPDVAAMEEVFMARNAGSALKLGQARGALIVACTQSDLEVHAYAPTLVKQSLVGFGRAEKGQIQHMVRILLKLTITPPEDAADALAIAICHAHHGNNQL
ncbi:MAG: crossover junction endodeoxyribonuclease RuvC [Mariprofundales bacterium]